MAPTTTASPWLNTPSSLPAGCPWNPAPSSRSPDWPLPVPDLRSTSTVTESASSSENDNLSHPDSPHSPTSSPTTSHPPRSTIRWTTDHYDPDEDLLTPISSSRLSAQTPSVRTLPRCAVLNFRKEGDSLRWASRVTQNCGGVAARARNFEDAFSLEEFSSRALPMVWQSTGGNPRLSGANDDVTHRLSCEGENVTEGDANKPRLVDQSASEKNFAERSFRSGYGSQRSISKSPSFKRTMVMANEMRRPSFWSRLAQNNKYRGNAHNRLQGEDTGRGQGATRADGATRGFKKSTWNAVVKAVTRRNMTDADMEEERKSGKKGSLFRRLVDRKHGKEDVRRGVDVETARVEDRVKSLKLADERGGAIRLRRKNGVARHSVDSARDGFLPGRRVRSSLSGPARTTSGDVSHTSQDDQYVTFMTSEV